MTPDPLEIAQRIARGNLDPEARAWLSDGFAAWLAGAALADALRLDAPTRLRSRNRALREAADVLDEDGGPWARAGLLAAAILRFEANIAPIVRRNPAHPLGPVDTCLQRAAASGYRLPKTQRGLLDVLN